MSVATEPEVRTTSQDRLADFMASVVVFLVALPLCIGIAMASGVPVERGLITGIVGGIIVGAVTGSPLLVSGPAASLLVLVWELVQQHGLAMLGPVVVGAGIIQMAAGIFGLGQWFRAVSPAVIRGMLSGIGVLIVASQLHVMLDGAPKSSLFQNLKTFPGALADAVTSGSPALAVGLVTLAILFAWKRFRPASLSLIPPQLVAVVAVVAGCAALGADVLYLEVSDNVLDGVMFTTPGGMSEMLSRGLIGQCLVFAFVASAATLLTATAIDQIQSEVQTNYDQELFAQGLGNSVAGWLGGLPMTGVIVRSSANVEAGAKSALSTFLHGVWLLVFVVAAPALLALIPKATLAAILVAVGVNLAHPDGMKKLDERSRSELVVGLITLGGVVGLDLFSGILLGIGASILRLVSAFLRFEVEVTRGEEKVWDLYLSGFATFLQLPKLASALDAIPGDASVTVHLQALEYADHAAFEQLAAAERRLRAGGGSLSLEWDELVRRYEEGPAARGGDDARRIGALNRLVETARRAVGMRGHELKQAAGHLEIEEARIHLDLPGGELKPTLDKVAAPLLEGLPGDAEETLGRFEDKAAERALALGDGVILVHDSLPGFEGARFAFARLEQPLRLVTGQGDLLFVLVDSAEDPDGHILALGALARLCASTARLESLRQAASAEEVRRILEDGIFEAEAGDRFPSAPAPGSDLVVIEPRGPRGDLHALEEALQRTFGVVAKVDPGGDPVHRLVAAATGAKEAGGLFLVDVRPERMPALNALLDEFTRTGDCSGFEVRVLHLLPGEAGDDRKAVGA